MKKKLLMVLEEAPYPASRNGNTLRYYPLIKALAVYLDIELVCFSNDDTPSDTGDLPHYTSRITVLPRSRAASSLRRKITSAWCMISPFGVPYQFYGHDAKRLAGELNDICVGHYDAVLWGALHLTQALRICSQVISADRWVVDMIDSFSLIHYREYGDASLKQKLMLAKKRRWEVDTVTICDLGVYISPIDRQEMENHVAGAGRLAVLPNGIFLESYTPEALELQRPSIGFLGNMSYLPNVDAVHALARIHARAKQEIDGLHLYIIGRDPLPEIIAYDEQEDITVTGTLDNIWPHVNGVDLFVLPMSIGAGQQNKMLEIMYANKPVICSSVSNGGVCGVNGESVLIADDEDSCVEQLVGLLCDPPRMKRIADGGAAFVKQSYSWDKVAADFYRCLVGEDETTEAAIKISGATSQPIFRDI